MAMTPAFLSLGVSDLSLTSAPRSLNDAVYCRFSNLSDTSAPVICESVRERAYGVLTTSPSIAAAAALMSSRVTAIAVPPSGEGIGRTS